MSNALNIEIEEVIVFFAAWFFFTCITYGTNVPAGLFMPGMILGCCVGNITGNVLKDLGIIEEDDPEGGGKNYENAIKNFIVVGTAAVLAGYTRMTYSLAVIMMETAQVMNLFVPIFFTVVISNKVGALFTRGLYVRAVRGK